MKHDYFESSLRHKDGHFIPIGISSSLVEFDGDEYLVSFVRDIRERKHAKSELRESEGRLRASEFQLREAQNLAKVGSWERHPETDTIRWSYEMLRIFAVPCAPLDLRTLLDYVHPRDREKKQQAEEKAGLTGTPVEVE